jgi:phosphosulfolactate synthase (CoM biosynthesis protein A)
MGLNDFKFLFCPGLRAILFVCQAANAVLIPYLNFTFSTGFGAIFTKNGSISISFTEHCKSITLFLFQSPKTDDLSN